MLYIFEFEKLKEIQCDLTEDQITIIKCLGKHTEKMYFFD